MKSGFASQTFDSQKVFRTLLGAMASPGEIMTLDIDIDAQEPVHHASGAILLTLMDFETPFWTDLENRNAAVQWLRFHTGAPYIHTAGHAGFALVTDYDTFDTPEQFNPGTIESPDLSTTLIVHTRGLDDRGRIRLTGPGIRKERFINFKGIKENFFAKRKNIVQAYPLGIDIIFVCDRQFTAIPRTTTMEVL
ncbi:MAG: phosphonate C-P lyase system protein PhnH [Desulfobacterales bacterium]|nr:phosphonate C-P lyase system protein PhnH [Desulfobacterales bacterium]